jgi:hypothetical protein
MNREELIAAWQFAKLEEQAAQARRRKYEDALLQELSVDATQEGVTNWTVGQYQVKVTGRLNRKIDADKLQEVAAENGLQDHLSTLFRWKPEINMALWKAADSSITDPLLDAITTTPGRPSFSITTVEE